MDDNSNDELPEVEDYEGLGHTFLGGRVARNQAQRVITEEAREPLMVDWTRVILWAIGAAVIALGLLIAGVIIAIVHHVQATHAATTTAGPSKNSGQVFAVIVVIVVAMLAVRAVVRFIRGE